MKIVAKSKTEFEEIVRMSKYLHDFCVEINKGLNWKFWQWFYIHNGKIQFDPYHFEYVSLDLDKFPTLNGLAHLYRIKHAGKEGQVLEQKALEKHFFVERK